VSVHCLQIFCVVQSRKATVLYSHLKTPVFISCYIRWSSVSLQGLFMPEYAITVSPPRILCLYMLYHIPYLCFWTWLFHYSAFTKTVYSKPAAGCQSVNAYTAVALYFQYQLLKRRPVQETLIGYSGLHNKFGSIVQFSCIVHANF
jgi:hypothetical protein